MQLMHKLLTDLIKSKVFHANVETSNTHTCVFTDGLVTFFGAFKDMFMYNFCYLTAVKAKVMLT